MMTLRDLLKLPRVSLDSKIYVYLDEPGACLCHVALDPEITPDKRRICLLPTAEMDEDGEDED